MKLPAGWKLKSVETLFEVQLGKMLNQAAKNAGQRYPYLTNTNVQWGYFRLDQLNTMTFSEMEMKKFALKNGDLMVCEGGEVGRCAIWREEVSPCYYQKALHRLRPLDKQEILPEFMLAYMQAIAGTKRLGNLTSQSSIAHLTREKLLQLDVHLPPLGEQQSIALVLGACDRGIEAQQELLEAKMARKRGLMQQLLTGQTRFKEFKGERWQMFKLGEVFTERVEIGREDLPLVSITGQNGVVPRESLAKRDTSSEDKSRYLRIAPGDIGYNTMRMWQGVSGLSKLEGIVSPAYTICVPSKRIDGQFAAYLFKHAPVVHLFRRYSQGLVDDTLALKFPNFAQIHVTIPEVPEQRRIAAVLETCDREIELLQKQLDALKEQKRGLMQKLLTGEIRVKEEGRGQSKHRQDGIRSAEKEER
jgi:type I restriction enzyme S subunit